MAWLEQSLPEQDARTVYDFVADGLQEVGELLKQYHHAIADPGGGDLRKLEQVQHALEARDGWRLQQRVETVLSQLQLPADKRMSELSGEKIHGFHRVPSSSRSRTTQIPRPGR